MLGTIGIKEEKIGEAVLKLVRLKEQLEEVKVSEGKEEGGGGTAYEKMEQIETKTTSARDNLKKLIDATVTFLEGTKESVQKMDKKAGKRMERIV